MPVDTLGLYELIAPQFLAGFQFPGYIDSYLSRLGVDELRTAFDDNAIVYTGKCSFNNEGGASPVPIHRDPSGAVFEWDDVTIEFRLTVPRSGSAAINAAVNTIANPPLSQTALQLALANLGAANATPTDFPSFAFQLELMVTALTFHLPSDTWIPGMVGPDLRVVPDPNAEYPDVRFVLPKIILDYTQDANFNNPPNFRLRSWGSSGFEAPADLAAGELIRMVPEIALHKSGQFGFGVSQVILDLSEDSTPPEILQHFGTDEGWTGLYIKSARFFYSNANKDFALNIGVKDVLISFVGEVSLEARVDLLFDSSLSVNVDIYDGPNKIDFNRGVESAANTWTNGAATMPNYGVIQVQAIGGTPGWTTSVTFQEQGSGPIQLWDETRRDARFTPPPNTAKTGTLVITVTDSSSPPRQFQQTISLTIIIPPTGQNGGPFDNRALSTRQPASFVYDAPAPGSLPNGYRITHIPSTSGTVELLQIEGGTATPIVTINGQPAVVNASRQVILNVPPGSNAAPIQVQVDWPGSADMPGTFDLFFDYDLPENDTAVSTYIVGNPSPADTRFSNSRVSENANGQPLPGAANLRGKAALEWWVQNCLANPNVSILASASYESHPDRAAYNLALSERRSKVAEGILLGAGAAIVNSTEVGQAQAQAANRVADPKDRVAKITGTPKPGQGAISTSGKISRPPDQVPIPPVPPVPVTPTSPPPATNKKPDVLKRLSFRVRLERNIPVLLEISGEIDFETKMEETLHSQPGVPPGGLGGSNLPAASSNPNPQDGVVDFKLLITYDTATNYLTEALYLGANPADKDGLYQITSNGNDTFKNILGALLIFAPITNAVAGAVDPDSAGDWVGMAVSLAVPVAIGGIGFVRSRKITLYGGELTLRQNVPSGSPATFTDSGIVFDYGVEFDIAIPQLNIQSTRPLKVRYKAIGFNLHWGNPVTYQPIFDTSKGYEIDLSDPGLFTLPSPLGEIIQVLAARIARFNPLTLELDLAIKADLGVITVDRFKVKWPLDPLGIPMILPSGVRVDIPATLRGSGYVNILPDGFEGTMDLTLVPLKLRVAASVGVRQIEEPRKATAFFLGLLVEFPVPIILGQTGLGIYGFNGVFAMHYKRLEPPPVPSSPVGPALNWLQNTYANGGPGPVGVQFWGPELDHWSFGVGVLLGTVEGGFLLNLQGMFMLELPGPRILILVKAQIITPLPGMGKGELTVGILGVLDLNFQAGSVTLGVLIDLDIVELIQIRIPIEVYFNWDNTKLWHVWLGTITVPVSANVFNLVRASGYFMIGGEDIHPFPPGTTATLPGIAVATGIAAEIVWGSKSISIYARVAAGADLGISFQPKLFIIGRVFVEGELRLIIISIGVHGDFLLKAPDPVYLKVHICGEIDLFFFSIEACVEFEIGNDKIPEAPPDLIKGMYLQSYAPLIVSGQGGERPIDATLGDAAMFKPGDASPDPAKLPIVPIDSVPVLQLFYSPKLAGNATTFTEPLKIAPGLTGDDGKVAAGAGRKVQYTLNSLAIDPPLPASTPKPPATWRKEQDPSNSSSVTAINLALFSRSPVTANYALERSNELNKQVDYLFGDICRPPAPPACVLWTFCRQRIGPSGRGWLLKGKAWPDPTGTVRDQPVDLLMRVNEPVLDTMETQLNELARATGLPFFLPAMVVGIGGSNVGPAAESRCRRALQLPDIERIKVKNPLQTNEDVQKAAEKLIEKQYITLVTGFANRVRLALAVDQRAFESVFIRELDSKGKVVSEKPLFAFNPVNVNNTAFLPGTWTDSTGPWAAEVISCMGFVSQTFPSLMRLLVEIKPQSDTNKIQIVVKRSEPDPRPPVVLLVAAEVCSKAEQDRFEIAVGIQKGKLETVVGFLDGGAPVPLLEPSTTYTVTAVYTAKSFDSDGNEDHSSSRTQQFRFRTADPAKPLFPPQPAQQGQPNPPKPERLDPWVLATSPEPDEEFYFYEDPVRIVFNSDSIIQLFLKNGKKLRMELRAADGIAEPAHTVENLDKVISGFSSPFYEALQELIDSGRLKECLTVDVKDYMNASWTAPVKLRPLMNYTLDIVTEPPPPPPGDPNDPNTPPVVPLFRRSFNTGVYSSIEEIAADLRRSKVLHRSLNSAIDDLPSTGPVADQQIQDALVAAGEEVLGPAQQGRIKIYWIKVGNQPYKPHAILIDSLEPIWRSRYEPKFESLDPVNDPSFKIVTPQKLTVLEVIGSSNIQRMVYSTAGTRTIVFLKNTFVGGIVTLQLNRPASNLYSIAAKTVKVIDLEIGAIAPWEDDEL